jgi:hypothetical protein
MEINPQERLDLRRMVRESECGDNTDEIRRLKHSTLILDDVSVMEKLKRSHKEMRAEQPSEFENMCISKCSFLFNHYTDIFNKLLKDEINLVILVKMIRVLKMIEDGAVDQHEGSVIVGKLLKELYVDSALRRGENLDKERKEKGEITEKLEPAVNISWKEYKKSLA